MAIFAPENISDTFVSYVAKYMDLNQTKEIKHYNYN